MALTDKLNQLNDLLTRAEDELYDRGYRVTAEVCIGSDALIWAKKGADWMLLYRPAGEGEHPVSKTSAGRRIAAANNLPRLLEVLDDNMSERESVVDGAIDTIVSVLTRIKDKEIVE